MALPIQEKILALVNKIYPLMLNHIGQSNGAFDDIYGLKNGHKIVKEYVDHFEFGLALEHIIYMIDETDLKISVDIKHDLTSLKKNIEA